MLKNRLLYLVIIIFVLTGATTAWYKRWDIHDFIVLHSYNPSAEVAGLATDGGFNDYGKRLFYVNKPVISSRDSFNQQCTSHEQTIVLGCYTGNAIYIFKVEDVRLDGVEQVTSAHEMLHAAYSRLSNGEKIRIDDLVNRAFAKIDDKRLKDLAAGYEKEDPGSVPNELHSILATEVENIGDELETYYSRYFDDRSKVVSLAKAYEQVFEDLRQQVIEYDSQLASQYSDIKSRQDALAGQADQIRQLNERMTNLLNSNQTRAYNELVPQYNALVNSYNAEVETIKMLIDQYNKLVVTRNAIATEQQNLAQSIDSRPEAISNN